MTPERRPAILSAVKKKKKRKEKKRKGPVMRIEKSVMGPKFRFQTSCTFYGSVYCGCPGGKTKTISAIWSFIKTIYLIKISFPVGPVRQTLIV